ncbi:MAG: hypothetical protein IKZ99_12740 [Salinivirgaceae bacterium]|nr:hypothetical protein [Salinivirgaceae bacterium]
MKRKISIGDITMKQAADKAGYAFSFREKIELAKMLDRLGLSVIETGPIADGKTDSLLIKSIASAVQNGAVAVPLNIAEADTVETTWNALKSAAHPRLQISVPVSTVQMEYFCHKKPAAVLELIGKLTKSCRDLCADVEFVAEDFGRADKDFLPQAVKAAVDNGATIVTVCDAAGNLLPEEFFEMVKQVKALLPDGVKLGVRCSNEFYLADSCAIAAVRAGADEIKTAPFGNFTVSLERFVKILNVKADVCGVCCDVRATELHHGVEQIKRLCQTNRSKPTSFSNLSPADRADIQLTIHDSKETVIEAVKSLNFELTDEDAQNVYDAFLKVAESNEVVGSKELDAIVATVAFQVPPTYKLGSYVINSGNQISATCHITLKKGDQVLDSVCVGDGPIDAAFQAIDKVIGHHYELDDFQIQSVTEGREAMGETVVRLRSEGKIYSGRGISTDIVGSSIAAYINAVNKIAFEEA